MQTHQPYVVPQAMYNQHGFQFQDWNNFNNGTYHGGRSGCGGRGRGGRGRRGGRGGTRREKKYCWTHGLENHNRKEYNSPAQGHQAEVNLKNRMGSSNQGCMA